MRPSFAFTSVLVFFVGLRFGFCSVSCFLPSSFGFRFVCFLLSPPLRVLSSSRLVYLSVVLLSKQPFVVVGSYDEVWGDL